MDISVQLQVEALKLLQEWSIWLVAVSSGFLGLMAYAFKNLSDDRAIFSAKFCIGSLILSLVFAIVLVGAIPATMQKIEPGIQDNPVFLGIKATGIYGKEYLDRIPLWLIVSGQRISFLVSLFFGARLLFLRALPNNV